MYSKSLYKYFERYAESASLELAKELLGESYSYVLCVPVRGESNEFWSFLESLPRTNELVILNLNSCPNSSLETLKKNDELFEALHRQALSSRPLGSRGHLFKFNGFHLALMDNHSQRFRMKNKQGVGHARRLCADIAAYLIREKVVSSPYIFNTDADAILPSDYFNRVFDGPAAFVYPFTHNTVELEEDAALALKLYERSLHYYTESLKWAGSPYAYHSIGSCIAIDFTAYAKVRGFPKKLAGEDFYLLNKLAKIGKVHSLNGDEIQIQGRTDIKTPFGTAKSVDLIRKRLQKENIFDAYDPRCFSSLKKVLDSFNSFSQHRVFERLCAELGPDSPELLALTKLGFRSVFQHLIRITNSHDELQKHLSTWFDSFRTLKFIHFLSADSFPKRKFHINLRNTSDLELLSSRLRFSRDQPLYMATES